jgi:hypothetical protein
MSNSLKQVRRIMLVIFAATTGVVACESATAPDQSVAEEFRAVDRQVDEGDLMQDIDLERIRSKGSGEQVQAE